MRVTTDISKTDRKTIYVNNLEGIDVRGSGTLTRGIKTKNLIAKNGKVVKRNGWCEQFRFTEKIDAISSVVIKSIKYVLVYSGKKFYLIQGESITEITQSASEGYEIETENLKSQPLTILSKNGVYYIIGAGVYLELGDFGKGIELRSVKKDAYIPTTTIGIMPEGKTIYVADKSLEETSRGMWFVKSDNGYSSIFLTDENPWNPETTYYNRVASYQMESVKMEEVNILTPYRINTLYGVSSSATYQLDSKNIIRDKKLKIKLKVLEAGETNEYTLTETASSNLLRGIEEGDNLKGKTITVKANTDIIHCSGLQNGTKQKGKVILKGENIECFWKSIGMTPIGWNNAKLILKYYDSDNVLQETEIAEAKRNNIYAQYSVTYNNLEITLSNSQNAVVETVSNSVNFSEQVLAMLPSSTYHLIDQNLLTWGSLNHKTGKLTFNKATTTPDGSDNIEVLFSVSDRDYNSEAIDNCTLATEFGVDGNTDRLFISGNSEYKNVDFASDSEDYSYFPMDYVYKFGLDSTPITGYSRLSDDSLVIFKDTMGEESNVYIRRGKWATKTIAVGENSFSYKKAEFTINGSFVSNSSINGRLNKIIDGEPVFLTKSGIYSLKSSIDLMTERKSAVNRGVAVDSMILPEIEKATDAVIYKNDYYLLVGDKLYIAKSNSYFIENSYKQYNWWVYDNIPACTMAVINEELWFGTVDGRICKFSDGYADITYEEIPDGSFAFTKDSKFVAFSERIRFKKNDEIILNGEIYSLLFDNITVKKNKLYIDNTLNLGEIEVYADNVGESGLETNTAYYIKNINTSDNSFELFKDDEKVNLQSGGFRLSVMLKGKPIKVEELRFSLDTTANDICVFSYNKRVVVPINYNDNAIPNDVTAKKYIEKPVIAEWKTQPMDLNSPTMLKKIHRVGLEFGKYSGGTIELLAEGKNAVRTLYNSYEEFSCLYPNLANFTFSGESQKSVYAHARFRGINTISLVIISGDAKPFELKSFSVEFSLLKQKRGIIY